MDFRNSEKNLLLENRSYNCSKTHNCSSNISFTFLNHTLEVNLQNLELELKFSWKISNPKSNPCGFQIETKRYFGPNEIASFCPQDDARYNSSIFEYECVRNVTKSENYGVKIFSSPNKDPLKNFETWVPSCPSEIVSKSKHCPKFEVIMTECKNRTFGVKYNITRSDPNKTTAYFRLCKNISPLYCANIQDAPVQTGGPSGTMNISLPPKELLSNDYQLQWWVKVKGKELGIETRSNLNVTDEFRFCASNTKNLYYLYIVFACLAAAAFTIIAFLSYKLKFGYSANCMNNNLKSLTPPTVYILFVNDHPRHLDVVLRFASFLKIDLRLHVLFELYQREKIHEDPVIWMESSLSSADKVLFIWSPGATKRCHKLNGDELKLDMFTPVLRKSIEDMQLTKNFDKYIFIEFDYGHFLDAPVQLKHPKLNHFKLMKDFQKFYDKLGVPNPQVVDHSCLHTVCVPDYVIANSQYGVAIQESILDMKNYANDNPKWFEENNCHLQKPMSFDSNVKILHHKLDIAPPSPIDFTG